MPQSLHIISILLHPFQALGYLLSAYSTTLGVYVISEDEAYDALRKIEQPLELALQQYTLKDCSRLGIFLKSEGTAIAENVVRNGPYCESTTLGTTFRVGLATASGFQCQDNEERLKICTFNAQMGCSMSSVFGNTQDCLLYTSPSPRDRQKSRMPSSA